MNISSLSRRRFLGVTAAATAGHLIGAPAPAETVSFFLVGDTHYLASKTDPSQLDEASAHVTAGLIRTLNALPGTAIPGAARAGIVAPPRGLLHVGDLIDSGDKNGEPFGRMQQTELDAWGAAYGLTGGDGQLRFPVYELHGNHDAPQGQGLVIDFIKARNRRRPGVGNVSANGLHYSWDWGSVHFVSLGLIVGTQPGVERKRRYAALDSLAFLQSDLAEKVGQSGRPVVLLHHVDVGRYTTPGPWDPAAPATGKEWDPCDVHAFYEAIRGFNVAAIFYGHTHAREVFRWDGAGRKSAEGIAVFNVDNGSHFKMDEQAFFHVEISPGELLVREYASPDRWDTGAWTPESWAVPLKPPAA